MIPAMCLQAGKAIKKAFEMQQQNKGFAMVEVLSTCSVNWGMTPVERLKWVEENMVPYYPLGVYRDVTAKEGN
jgi:2-oxoglutarate ferredoxin oxidoreductase subunit beta